MAASERTERTYGNWRRPTSPGVFGMGLLGTLIMLGGLVIVVITAMFSRPVALILAGVLALVLAPLVIRDRHGRSGLQGLTARIAFSRGRRAGQHLYRSGPLGATGQGSFRLPGLAAPSTVYDAEDSYRRPFGMIVMGSTGHYTVVFETAADGAALVDPDQVDIWVAYWGQWLASLAFEPALVAASVTVETAPDFGTRLQTEVATRIAAEAPALARQALQDVVRTYPAGSALVSTRIALTYSASVRPGAKRRGTEEMAREIGTRIPGLGARLSMTGAGQARPMTGEQLAEAVRVAYDPSAQVLIDQSRAAGGSGLTWADAGPVSHEEYVDHYLHDGAASITWGMSDAPRGEVYSSVLTGLLEPHRDIARKRVSMLYRPHDPATATRMVQRDRKDAMFKGAVPGAAARDTVAIEAARQSEREEATGAGLTRFAMLVTATVRHPDDLPAAAAAIDLLAPPARVQLRRMHRTQAAAFAAALPIGIVLPDHLQVPQIVRDAL